MNDYDAEQLSVQERFVRNEQRLQAAERWIEVIKQQIRAMREERGLPPDLTPDDANKATT